MKLSAILIFLTLYLSVNTANGDRCGNISYNSLAANGSPLNSSAEYSWSALLVYEGLPRSFYCGGVLVNNLNVLTTAECLQFANVIGVRLGVHNLTSAEDCVLNPTRSFTRCDDGSVIVGVKKTVIHPNYTLSIFEKKQFSNVGLIRLKESSLPKLIRPICLPGATPLRSDKYFAAGWGASIGLGPLRVRRIKHATQVERLNDTLCFGTPNPIFDDNFCMVPANCKNAWVGDLGGALVALDDKSRATLVGLVMGLQEGCTNYVQNDQQSKMESSALYEDVQKHIKWIQRLIRKRI